MKKLILAFVVLFVLVGCTGKEKNEQPKESAIQSEEKASNVEKNDLTDSNKTQTEAKLPDVKENNVEATDEQTEEKDSDSKQSNIKDNTSNKLKEFNQDEWIRSTFLEYGYEAPDRSQWIVKEEGNGKVAVIIKENIHTKGKPDISKLIFIKSDTEPKILHLMVKNRKII